MSTLVYVYGARGPLGGSEELDRQFALALRYRNAGVARELDRRAATDAVLASEVGGYQQVLDDIASVTDTIRTFEDAARADSASEWRATGKPTRVPAPDLTSLREVRRGLWEKLKALRAAAFKDARIRLLLEPVQERARYVDRRDRRRFRELGLAAETLAGVRDEQRKSLGRGAPPQWATPDRLCKIRVCGPQGEARGDGARGAAHWAKRVSVWSPAVPCMADGTELEGSGLRPGVWAEGTRRMRRLGSALVSIRVSVTGRGNQSRECWVQIPTVLHREFPPLERVRSIELCRKSVGGSFQWEIHVCHETEERERYGAGSVEVTFRGKRREDGSLVVAEWEGYDGGRGSIVLPSGFLSGVEQLDRLKHARDTERNKVRSLVASLLKERGAPEDVPGVWERIHTVASWNSYQRLHTLADWWRHNGPPGKVATALRNWRKQDRHLWSWEGNLRQQVLRMRLDTYRVAAARLGERYATAVVPSTNLAVAMKRSRADEAHKVKGYSVEAAFGQLKLCLAQRMEVKKAARARNGTRKVKAGRG